MAVLLSTSAILAFSLQSPSLAPVAVRHGVARVGPASMQMPTLPKFKLPFGDEEKERVKEDGAVVEKQEDEEDKMTIEKIASFGIAGILSIAVAESVFWILSFPTSELLYFAGTGEWIDLTSQEGQLKFLAFTAGWGALGGVIAQYRTVLTAAAMTPWMDA